MKKKKKNKISHKKIPVTKSLGGLMKDEDGFVSKETILKVGLSTVAALGMTGALTDSASAQSMTSTHTNTITLGPLDNCAQHSNVTVHTY